MDTLVRDPQRPDVMARDAVRPLLNEGFKGGAGSGSRG